MNKKAAHTVAENAIREQVNLRTLNSFGVEAGARYFSEITDATGLQKLISEPVFRENNVLVLGGGSNILF